jgi:hypothetical protein
MAHLCPTCSEICYCMGDYSETLSGQPAYCKHCTEYELNNSDEPDGNYNWDGTIITEFDED